MFALLNRLFLSGLAYSLLVTACSHSEKPTKLEKPVSEVEQIYDIEHQRFDCLWCTETTAPVSQPEIMIQAEQEQDLQVVRMEHVGQLSNKSIFEIQKASYKEALEGSSDTIYFNHFEIEPYTSLTRHFKIHFENDIFAERDQYYTNGIAFTWIHPYFIQLPLTRYLPGLGRQSMNYYGLHLRQMMFTPIHPETDEIVANDRPFAGVLYLGFFRSSTLNHLKLTLQSEIQLGAIGPLSLAESLQRSIHDKEPNGWNFQIHNDLLINFNLRAEKTVLSTQHAETGLIAEIKVGSLHTNAAAGLFIRYGHYAPHFNTLSTNISLPKGLIKHQPVQYWLYGRALGRQVGYDASLNGGLFNNNSPHYLIKKQLHSQVLEAELGTVLIYKQYGLQFSYTYLSPEFTGGGEHFWGNIKLIYIY